MLPFNQVVIDDGGHTMKQQITTLDFWIKTPKAIKEGGVFIMEDLLTSYYGLPFRNGAEETTVDHITSLLNDMHKSMDVELKKIQPKQGAMREAVGHVDCYPEACVFEKRRWRPIYESREK